MNILVHDTANVCFVLCIYFSNQLFSDSMIMCTFTNFNSREHEMNPDRSYS